MWKVLWAIRPLLRPGRPARSSSSVGPSLLEHLVESAEAPILPARGSNLSRSVTGTLDRRARGVLARRPRLVPGELRGADRRPGPGLGGDRPGEHTLIHAPTGSGKTLAAFLWCLDRLATIPRPAPTRETPASVRVLYVSPLKALTYDVERNLRAPLAGIALAAERLGEPVPRITVASRTGDTPAEDRRQLARHPPDILITTPESLYLMLTSAGARGRSRRVEHVIVDEVHAIAGTKRGAHLALSLERLEALIAGGRRPDARPTADRPVRHAAAARRRSPGSSAASGPDREVTIVDAGARKALDLQVVVPVDDMTTLGEVLPLDEQPGGPATKAEAADEHLAGDPPADPRADPGHRSTIVFTNSRRLAERLAQRLNELAGEELVRAHHGSHRPRAARSRSRRSSRPAALPALVATSSLELGIDMGAVDLVIQVECPTCGRPRPPAGRPGRPPGRRAVARA